MNLGYYQDFMWSQAYRFDAHIRLTRSKLYTNHNSIAYYDLISKYASLSIR